MNQIITMIYYVIVDYLSTRKNRSPARAAMRSSKVLIHWNNESRGIKEVQDMCKDPESEIGYEAPHITHDPRARIQTEECTTHGILGFMIMI